MAATSLLYGSFIGKLANKEIDIDSDTFKVMLCTSSYTPNQDTHDYKDDVTNEITGTGYTAGGATLASVSWTYSSGSNTWTFDAADVSWTGTLTARYAVIYDSTPATDATRPLVGVVDFGQDQGVIGGAAVAAIAVPIVQANIPEDADSIVWRWLGLACAATVVVTAVVTKIVNALEAAGKIPAWLKEPAATPANPDPEDDEPGRHAADGI